MFGQPGINIAKSFTEWVNYSDCQKYVPFGYWTRRLGCHGGLFFKIETLVARLKENLQPKAGGLTAVL